MLRDRKYRYIFNSCDRRRILESSHQCPRVLTLSAVAAVESISVRIRDRKI